MDIKQVFKSISDGQTISELEMGGADPRLRYQSLETLFTGRPAARLTLRTFNPG